MTESPQPGEPRRRSKQRDWEKIRDDYLLTQDSLKIVAERHGVPLPTVRDRSIAEGWAVAKQSAATELAKRTTEVSRSTTENILKTAVARSAATAALNTTALINRSLKESETWLNRIDSVAQGAAAHNPDAIRKLTASWKDVISVARITHGLDQTGTTVNVAVFGKPQAIEAEPIDVQVVSPPEHNT